jgi:hypothetical protein
VVIARVGALAVTNTELSQWMGIMAPGHVVPDPPRYASCVSDEQAHGQQPIGDVLRAQCEAQYVALRAKALRFLIASDWLIAEASTYHLAPSDREVAGWLSARHVGRGMSASAQRLVAERELAARRLEHEIRAAELPITKTQISRYYTTHISRFERRERRYVDMIENLGTEAAAQRVLRELIRGNGKGIVTIHESFDRPHIGDPITPGKWISLRAIFAGRPHVYVGPLNLDGNIWIFRIVRIVPRLVQPLARVEGAIGRQFAEAQHRRTLARFLGKWRPKWIAMTSCQAGYLVPECQNYSGPPASEEAPTGLS